MTISKHINLVSLTRTIAAPLAVMVAAIGWHAQAAEPPIPEDFYGTWSYPAGTTTTISCAGFPATTREQAGGEIVIGPGTRGGELSIESPADPGCPIIATLDGDTLRMSSSTRCAGDGRRAQVEVTSLSLQSADGNSGSLALQLDMQTTVDGQALQCGIAMNASVTHIDRP